MLAVRATNNEAVPLDVTFATAHGEESLSDVAAGEHAFHAFSTRLAALPAGEATITASALVDGLPVTMTQSASYEPRSCGTQ